MTNNLFSMIMSDSVMRESAIQARQTRPGDLIPAVDFDWESNGYFVGLKDHKGRWVHRIFISAPLQTAKDFGRYLSGFAAALDHLP